MSQLRWPAIASTCYFGMAAFMVLNGLPAIAVALQGARGLSDEAIGNLAAGHLLGLAFSSAIAPFLIRRIGMVRVLHLTVLTILLGLILLAEASGLAGIAFGFIVTGLGTGIASAVTYMLFGEADQERNLSFFNSSQWASSIALLYFLPGVGRSFGVPGIFVCLALWNAASLALLRWIPTWNAEPSATSLPANPAVGNHRVWFRWLALSGIAALFACQGAIWTFLEIAGRERGFSAADASTAATLGPVFGLLGSFSVVMLGRRFGQGRPLIISAVALAVALAGMTSAKWGIYAGSICLFTLSFSGFMAYQFGLATDEDKSGFTAAWASTASYAGFAVGPAIAGVATSRLGPDGMIGVGIVGVVFAFIASAVPLLRAWR